MSEQLNSMQSRLKDAFEDKSGAAKLFFEEFITSEVFIPLKQNSVDVEGELPIVGDRLAEDKSSEVTHNFVSIEFEGNRTIPVFSKPAFLEQWAEKKFTYEKRKLSSLIQILDQDTWVYLDAAQEYGREFSPWELKMLQQGKEGIDSILQSDKESFESELEVVSNPPEFDELRSRLGVMFEPYLWVREARLINFRSINSESWTPLLGLSTDGDREEVSSKRQLLLTEIKTLFGEYISSESAPIVTDDITGPYHGLLDQQNPFYIRQEVSERLNSADIVQSLKDSAREKSD